MREKREDNWRRIESVVLWANMSVNFFARYIGLSRGENLYQIKRGNNGISKNVADRIVTHFPKIDKLWLLTGEGDMFADSSERGAQIPYYNMDVEQGIAEWRQLGVESEMLIPQFGDSDLAMPYLGHAMTPITQVGTVLILKAVDVDSVIPGGEYVIVGTKISLLRIVRAALNLEELRLVAGNREKFDDIILPKEDIRAVYQVKGKLIINN